jgi:hypothetical protein
MNDGLIKCIRAREEVLALIRREREGNISCQNYCFFDEISCWHRKPCRGCFERLVGTISGVMKLTARNISMPLG